MTRALGFGLLTWLIAIEVYGRAITLDNTFKNDSNNQKVLLVIIGGLLWAVAVFLIFL